MISMPAAGCEDHSSPIFKFRQIFYWEFFRSAPKSIPGASKLCIRASPRWRTPGTPLGNSRHSAGPGKLAGKKQSHEDGSYANDLSWKVVGLNHLSWQHLTPLEYIFKRFHEFALFCFANCFDCEGCIKISLLGQLGQMLLKRYTIGSSSKFELKDGNQRTFKPTDRPK